MFDYFITPLTESTEHFKYSILIIQKEECGGHPDELFSELSLENEQEPHQELEMCENTWQ